MKEFDFLDDHILSAFVDGQLDDATCNSVLIAMEMDPDVRDRVYQLRRAKDLMKLGFGQARPPSGKRRTKNDVYHKRPGFGLAASIAVLFISFISGSLGYYYSQYIGSSSLPTVSTIAKEETSRVILHVSEADPAQFAAALDYTDQFLKDHEPQKGQIAVIAHASGIDLMRIGKSPFEKRVIRMMRDHNNVYFIACAQAIHSLQEQGIETRMFENTITEKPAMDQIIERIQSGWRYIKVNSLVEL
jgi:intracellular sulfur oxidation DsrE/DsrF family protein